MWREEQVFSSDNTLVPHGHFSPSYNFDHRLSLSQLLIIGLISIKKLFQKEPRHENIYFNCSGPSTSSAPS